ncbi:MAG TPA: VOC family protein, partial [Puia sp.]|nr:VOC family protein [Puia sp.]
MTTQINAYLNFNGNCREAMSFYKDALGAELMLQTVAESPMAGNMPPELQGKILHSVLTKGSITLFGSDMIGNGLVAGNSVSLTINCSSEEEIDTFFANLSSGGKIKDPLADMFWGAKYGSLKDKFGM